MDKRTFERTARIICEGSPDRALALQQFIFALMEATDESRHRFRQSIIHEVSKAVSSVGEPSLFPDEDYP